jgi:hypothetical protein
MNIQLNIDLNQVLCYTVFCEVLAPIINPPGKIGHPILIRQAPSFQPILDIYGGAHGQLPVKKPPTRANLLDDITAARSARSCILPYPVHRLPNEPRKGGRLPWQSLTVGKCLN